ncbi:hypothetical protein QY97_03451 [Bacillus thermotolerans]|uniref:Uncharacterized protein n=1 Tax=Bacillus thermotolerans TaxID=1221996 RepID=A0A0F5HXR0_BACTR|nr:hypothetical protein QY97_03451 [Bacillus thermotolerans]KKB40738.1 hypothetical protein QY95_01312 [Bacillus thermotolerans]KKB41674.1 hypothetical protein QY96_01911 [Bacillus thermotolerans]
MSRSDLPFGSDGVLLTILIWALLIKSIPKKFFTFSSAAFIQ